MTAYELMDTSQNEGIKENKSHPSLKLPKFLNSTPALNTPPPESIDFYQEISLSDISLNRLEHIIEDAGFQEDTALTPLVNTPPQSAAFSLERKNFLKLSSEFGSKHSLFKLNLQRSFSRLNRLRQSYLSERPAQRRELAYEIQKNRQLSDNELSDDDVEPNDDSYWSSRRLRLGSEWTRCTQKLGLIQSKKNSLNRHQESTKLIHITNQLKQLSSKNSNAIDYLKTNTIKSNCACDSLSAGQQQMCIFCSLERLPKAKKALKRTLENIYFDHSYTKLPTISSNDTLSDLDFLNCVDDDALNELVNERLDKLFSSVDHLAKQNDPLPNLTSEELMEFFEEKFEPAFLDVENLSPSQPRKKAKTYNETNLRAFRFGATKNAPNQLNKRKECAKTKRVARSRSSSASAINDDAQYVSSNTDKYDINNILIPNELISNQKIVSLPSPKITTPSWRVVDIEPLCDGPKPDEELDDTSILNRHKIIEMKEIINFSNKKNSFDTTLKDSDSTLLSNGSNTNVEWPERKFPLSDQEFKLMVDES